MILPWPQESKVLLRELLVGTNCVQAVRVPSADYVQIIELPADCQRSFDSVDSLLNHCAQELSKKGEGKRIWNLEKILDYMI